MNNLYYNNKRLKQIQNKRTQKRKKVWGWILTILGGLSLPSAITAVAAGAGVGSLVSPLIFLIPGLFLLWTAKRQVDKWDRMEAIIDNRGNTPISLIAKKMKMSEQAVYSELQTMIHNDFFIGPNYNIEAYVDAERDLLVMCSGGEPLKPLPDPPTEEERRQAEQAKGWRWGANKDRQEDAKAGSSYQEAAASGTGTANTANAAEAAANDDEDIREVELTELEQIQQAITDTKDDEVRGYLYGLEGSLRRIDERMEEDPELMQKVSIKRLYKFYLPQILDLIRKYHAPDTPADLKQQIKDALATSAGALANIEADLLERDQMDAEVNIEVLKNMFAQDGLLERNGQKTPGQTTGAAQAQTMGAGQGQPQPQAQPQPQVQPR